MVTNRNEKEVVLNQSVGTVDYDTGKVCVGPLNIADTPDGNTRVPVVVLPDGNGLTIRQVLTQPSSTPKFTRLILSLTPVTFLTLTPSTLLVGTMVGAT